MKAFKNASVYIQGKGIVKTNVKFDQNIISIGEDVSGCEIVDVPNDVVVFPGFIDEHIHGSNNSDAMDGYAKDLSNIANSIAEEGVTGFLATTMTEKKEKILNALTAIGNFIESQDKSGAQVLGVHLEGPFISKTYCGAQDPKYIIKPTIDTFKEFNDASKGNIRLVTLAPEEDEENLIGYLSSIGVTASAGHTDSKYVDIEKALQNGLKSITHTYNVQKPIHHREIGTVGSAYMFDELYTECICDCIHISVPAIKLLLKNKPKDKFVVVTDAMRAKNLPNGESELGGQKVIVKDGEARLENGALAGSVCKMNVAIKNLVEKCGVLLTDAIDFATINPASNLGLDKQMGSIEVGKKANFALMDDNYEILQTIRDGEIIFEK